MRLISLLIAGLVIAVGSGYHYRETLAVWFWPAWHLRSLSDAKGALAYWARCVLDRQERIVQAGERPIAEARLRKIQTELVSHDVPEWAGHYATLWGGYGVELWIAPHSGFCYKSSSHAVVHWDYGTVVDVTDSRIVLDPVIGANVFYGGADKCYIRVQWVGRDYLIEPGWFLERFCNEVNEGDSGAPGWYLSRSRSVLFDPNAPLVVPPEYREHFFDAPRIFTLTDELQRAKRTDGGDTYYELSVRLEAPNTAGAFPKMELHLDMEDEFSMATVRDVDARGCTATIIVIKNKDGTYHFPKVGWKYSTRAYDEADFRADLRYQLEMERERTAEQANGSP